VKLDLGIVTPVVHVNPRFDPPRWEDEGTVEDVVAVARAADRLGYRWVACSEHVAIPVAATDVRGPRYWDPVATLGFLAAHTERVSLLSHVIVLSYHHPLEVVKRWGTVDLISHGRVILGVGVGSLEGEFALLGRDMADRGARSDDAMRAIRAAWGDRRPTYEGSHFSFHDVVVDPAGLDRPLEMWVGGRTRRSLRRAVELGDAWMPFRLLQAELREILAAPAVRTAIEARDRPFGLVFPPEPPLDPLADPDGTAAVVREFADLGATGLSLRFRHHSRTHFLEQMEAMQELVARL
jgi:probable F420-dependent oxidoreductase